VTKLPCEIQELRDYRRVVCTACGASWHLNIRPEARECPYKLQEVPRDPGGYIFAAAILGLIAAFFMLLGWLF